ncbi:galactose oxidase [Gonapodya prolifera JEL478]|uniref:Galactose oxidase n=1 Tax=Gonapodya prolifera (strain JEL478) TaxID=1344416 RepID=A0A139AFK7_GONPJ|nr:galactose oxidase [Gonapodya prolifera JEL478]|eukprot:KXS15577.1 galactose oxidase [Gonapodya prolifera JEL478]
MGKRDKRKKKKDATASKARDATKVAEKAARKEERKMRKKGGDDDDDDWSSDGEDVEEIVRALEAKASPAAKVESTVCPPPSPRSSAPLVPNPLNSEELILFGGEFFDGKTTFTYNDTFVYHTVKDEWRRISSPTSPTPRSSHQLVGNPSGKLYLFGGEFSSKTGSKFFHHKDFWTLDARTFGWTKVEDGKLPTPRSGHRMVHLPSHILLFGGFNDSGRSSTYLSDLWLLHLPTLTWRPIDVPFQYNKPTPRSGVSLAVLSEKVEGGEIAEVKVVLFGGYTKEVIKVPGRTPKEKPRNKLVGRVHNDMWLLTITKDDAAAQLAGSSKPSTSAAAAAAAPPKPDTPTTGAPLTFRWTKLRQSLSTSTPTPPTSRPPHTHPRSSPTLLSHRGRLVLFGGVFDGPTAEDDEDEDDLRGECTSEVWTAVVVGDTAVWYPGRVEGKEKERPVGRYGAGACVQKNTLFITSGLHEPTPTTIVTLDDIWTLPLDRLLTPTGAAAEWKCVRALGVQWDVGGDGEDSDEEEGARVVVKVAGGEAVRAGVGGAPGKDTGEGEVSGGKKGEEGGEKSSDESDSSDSDSRDAE